MASRIFGIADAVTLLEKLKSSHVDRTIWEHADQAHSDTSVAGSQTAICVHFQGRLSDKGAPRQAIFDSFALKSKFESIEGIDAESISKAWSVKNIQSHSTPSCLGSSAATYWAIIPARPPAANFEYELIFLASPWPSKLASARLAASYDPNLMAVSGIIFMTFNPLPVVV